MSRQLVSQVLWDWPSFPGSTTDAFSLWLEFMLAIVSIALEFAGYSNTKFV